jgi:hypothetical protein
MASASCFASGVDHCLSELRNEALSEKLRSVGRCESRARDNTNGLKLRAVQSHLDSTRGLRGLMADRFEFQRMDNGMFSGFATVCRLGEPGRVAAFVENWDPTSECDC